MARLARRHLGSAPQVEVRTERFEEAVLEAGAYGLVLCAQAWHWLDPGTRTARMARVLYAHGTAAVVANVAVVGQAEQAFAELVRRIYERHAPHLARLGPSRSPDDVPPHPLEGSKSFEDLAQVVHPWTWTVDAEHYAGLLSTHSTHAALGDSTRRRLLDEIAELIRTRFEGRLTKRYLAVASLGRRRV